MVAVDGLHDASGTRRGQDVPTPNTLTRVHYPGRRKLFDNHKRIRSVDLLQRIVRQFGIQVIRSIYGQLSKPQETTLVRKRIHVW